MFYLDIFIYLQLRIRRINTQLWLRVTNISYEFAVSVFRV